jgi:hypothetical protein
MVGCGLVKLNIGREKLSTMSWKDIHIILWRHSCEVVEQGCIKLEIIQWPS